MLLDAETDLSVIGEAADGRTALDLTASLGPDIVLMDVEHAAHGWDCHDDRAALRLSRAFRSSC